MVSADQYHLTVAQAQVSTHRGRVFSAEFSPPSSVSKRNFNCTARRAAHKHNLFAMHLKKSGNLSTHKVLTLSAKIQPAITGREGSCFLLSLPMVTRWSRSTSNFYALICQNLTGEFMRKTYAAPGNLFTDSWSWQNLSSIAGLFIGFLVEKCVACHRKSYFWCHRFRFSPCLIRKRVEKSQAILALLDGFQEPHLDWKPE